MNVARATGKPLCWILPLITAMLLVFSVALYGVPPGDQPPANAAGEQVTQPPGTGTSADTPGVPSKPDSGEGQQAEPASGNPRGLTDKGGPIVTTVIPPTASEEMPVVIVGEGFSEIPTDNTVEFSGIPALVERPASSNVLVVRVPAGAVTGLITVTVNTQTSAGFAFNVAPPPAPGLTDENAINLQTVDGTFPADMAISSTLLPHVQISVDPDLAGGAPVIEAFLIRPEAAAPENLMTKLGLFLKLPVPPYVDDADVPVDLGNNMIVVTVDDTVSFGASMLNFTPDTVAVLSPTDPELTTTDPITGETFHGHTLIVDFVDSLTDRSISEILQAERLRAVGVFQDITDPQRPKLADVDTLLRESETGDTVSDVENLLNTNPPTGVEGATVDVYREIEDVAAETIPARLRNGGANGTGGGGTNSAFTDANGGFDNDGSTVAGGDPDTVGVPGTPSDELNLFWDHFFMQTFAAHRLRDVVVAAAGGAAAASGLVIEDSGFGNGNAAAGANPVLNDLPLGRLGIGADPAVPAASFDGIDFSTGVRRPLQIAGLTDRADLLGSPVGAGHGTYLALVAAGNGTRTVLGTGKDANVFIYRQTGPITRDVLALNDAAARADVDVINFSAAVPNGTVAQFAARTALFRPAVRAMDTAGQIFVMPSGNGAAIAGTTSPAIPVNLAPPRGGRRAVGAFARFVVVGATDIVNTTRGQERRWVNSNRGNRVHVSAAGGARLIVTRPDGRIRTTGGGTSWAAPKVAGLFAELIQLDETLNGVPGGAAALRARRLRMVETVEATADDLGTTDAGAPHANNDAGDGADDHFGYGRINAWKAVLSVVNGGVSAQHGRADDGSGNDSVFPSLPLIDDDDMDATDWYGFEIITSERQATVWIDGTKLQDAGAATPPAGNDITAYKGVRSDLRIERGVHNLTDGSADDAAGGGRLGQIVEEDPTSGIVPVGTLNNNKGQYVITFSIQRKDLYEDDGSGNPDTTKPKTLSLRRRGQGVNDRPIFNLRMETTKMRTGEVSGVTFDDFVFQIAPPDYGDAALAHTLMNAEKGARHENTTLEWLGKLNPATDAIPNLKSVTPEHNADPENTGGDPGVDVDGVDNRHDFHDRDGRDDGVLFFPLTFVPNTPTGNAEFTVGVFDHTSPRYANNADQSLYVNLWIDWDTDGAWEEGASGEHVINGLRLNPQNGAASWIEDQGTSGSLTFFDGTSADNDRASFDSFFDVPEIECGQIWARMRVDYGENVGRNDPRPQFRSLPSLRDRTLADGVEGPGGADLGLVHGAARFGEVEDYLIGTDFGDAPDGPYPTLKVNMGARHLDTHQEWLGPDNNTEPNPTREIDANDADCAAAGGTDQDGHPNLDPEDTDDLRDDGVVIPPLIPGALINIDVTVTSSISARGAWVVLLESGAALHNVGYPEDDYDTLPRYSGANDDGSQRLLYLSGWADWNGDGIWATPGEKIIDDEIDPQFFGADGIYNVGEVFDDVNKNGVYDGTGPCPQPNNQECFFDDFGIDTKTFSYPVFVPFGIAEEVWFRFRLAYGENETTFDVKVKENDEVARANAEDKGGALFGEVEDYVVPKVIYCGPGDHWTDLCTAGVDSFGSDATVGVDTDLDCFADFTLQLSGPVTVVRTDPLDASANFPGSGTVDGHLDVIDTEIVNMMLTGGGVTLTVGGGQGQGGVLAPTLGTIVETPADASLADSFFDVMFEVDLGDGTYWYNYLPHRVSSIIEKVPPKEIYLFDGCIPVYDSAIPGKGLHVANITSVCHGAGVPCEPTTPTCETAGDCCDTNADGVIDDVCTWCECVDGTCNTVTTAVPADLGGSFGNCTPDGFCNIHDANHALSCFSGLNTCGDGTIIDAGGPFGTCAPDGFCNIHDANHALSCFSGLNTCVCAPPPVCGNGSLEPGEQCDDGNTANGDGCDANCLIEFKPTCGDGILDGSEDCDDGNTFNGDCCSSVCLFEPEGSVCGISAECTQTTCDGAGACFTADSPPGTPCGDPQTTECSGPDACDGAGLCTPNDHPDGTPCGEPPTICSGQDTCDGAGVCVPNNVTQCIDGDGCCPGLPFCDANSDGDCLPVCGNGVTEPGEQCDDGNTLPGDGCDSNCQLEPKPGCPDGLCDPFAGEDSCTCPQDCGFPPPNETPFKDCQDGQDNDCDGKPDCADIDCFEDPACGVHEGDDCFTAIVVSEGTYFGQTATRTNSGITPSCGNTNNPDEWWQYVASCSGTATVDTAGTNDDTVLAVYADCFGAEIVCDDDALGWPPGESLVQFGVVAGVSYWVQVHGWGAGATLPSYVLNINCSGGTGPANDDCTNPVPLSDGATPFSTIGATTDGPDYGGLPDCGPFGDDNVHNDIWFDYVASCTGQLLITTCEQLGGSADFDTRIAVHDGCIPDPTCVGGTPIACNDDDPVNPCGSGSGGFHSTLNIPVSAGNCYTIRVGGFSAGDVGNGVLQVQCTPASPVAPQGGDADAVTLIAEASQVAARPGDKFAVRVFLDGATDRFQSYQLHLGVSGGRRGHLDLVDVTIEDRDDFAFHGEDDRFSAVNVNTGQMLAGLYQGGVATSGRKYLATFTYRVSPDAAGTFVVDVLHDESKGDQTYLIASFVDEIKVGAATPAVVIVAPPADGTPGR